MCCTSCSYYLCSFIVGVRVLYIMLLMLVLFYCRSECAVHHAPNVGALLL